jgi:hypothetical protein
MRTNLLLMIGIIMFVVVSVVSVIYLKGHFDEQKGDLLDSLPPLPASDK